MIDINGIAEKAVNAVFDVFEQILVTGEIVEPDGDYDPTTGGPTGSEVTHVVSEIALVDYESSRVDGEIIRELDKQALFRASEISVAPTEEMLLRLVDGDWDIIQATRDPTGTLYELQIRKP